MALDREVEFERLVLPHRVRMMRTIWRIVRDADLAEDALQEALATLWRKLPVVSRHPNPQAFVLRVSIDAARDQLRARQRQTARTAALDEIDGARPGGSDGSLEQAVLHDEVLACVHRLRPRQATAFLLRALEDAPYRSIAQALGCRESTARAHVLQARAKLRGWFSHLRVPVREKRS